ncbi:MAG: FAD-dependent oxidoreductase [Flavobacteriales bacterium]|nr:FAD-dependent oxidoreductase [Flavobacteriales bacterium]MBT6745090.1 FAD-dependent oxidoreductase [Flavobacteriales bacterium]
MSHVVIIGNGVSGITAARHIRKKDRAVKITVISTETDYFYSRTALMYIYMGHMTLENTQPYEAHFWEENRIELKRGYVNAIDYDSKSIKLEGGDSLDYDSLVLAVGSKSNKFGWKGQDLPGVQGLYNYQDLELLEENSKGAKRAVIIGGGLIGIELAEMLLSRGIQVSIFIREERFWNGVLPDEESDLITRHIHEHGIDLRKNIELDEIIAGPDGRVQKVRTKAGEEIECQIVGLTAGVSPNVDFLKGSRLELDRGILVNQYLETNIPDVYAVGDCAQFREPVEGRSSLEQVWYTGKIMGETVASTITGKKLKYNPGHWFNSAKFLDIEYQTYGWVFSKLREGEADFYWEHEDGKMCMHFVYEAESRKFLGMNTFGIRLRHHAFDAWLKQSSTIDSIMEHLKDANFDPEFYSQYEDVIVDKFNKDTGASVVLKARSWDRIIKMVKG